jgi:glycine cleavage system transcriptional repressor
MRTAIVVTLTGPDRVGIVEEVTAGLLAIDGNVETSRMMRLGGEFAIIMLATVPDGVVGRVEAAFEPLASQGYRVACSATAGADAAAHAGWRGYRIDVTGADHEGIVHEIAAGLSGSGVTIESMETTTTKAPMSAMTLFAMSAEVLVPPAVDEVSWMASVLAAGEAADVDVSVRPLA